MNHLKTYLAGAAVLLCMVYSCGVVGAQQFELPPAPEAAQGGDAFGDRQVQDRNGPRIEGCVVQLVNDIELHARESGSLVHLAVKEGSVIHPEQVIAQIDDRTARQAFAIAKYGSEAAKARAEDDIQIIYSMATARVAQAELAELRQANDSVSKAVTNSDMRKAELELDKSKLGIEKAKIDRELAGLDAKVKLAEQEAAQIGIDQRQVLAPFEGTVVEIFRHQEEWVQAGEPILRVIRLDTLKVEGYVYYEDFDPNEVDGCEVTIEVAMGKKSARATGRVVYIDPVAKFDGRYKYKVQAEIANRQENGRWLISPKLPATMKIHLGTGGVANARR